MRDLLALDIDVAELLPADDSSRGFDNVGDALRLSQSLMERYLAAARTVSRWAVGSPPPAVVSHTYRIATDMQQHDRVEALPFGTRGGTLVSHLFPQDAEYALQVELVRATGGRLPQRLEVTVDGDQVALVLTRPSRRCTGHFFIDDEVLRESGVTDLSRYLQDGAREEELMGDFFL